MLINFILFVVNYFILKCFLFYSPLERWPKFLNSQLCNHIHHLQNNQHHLNFLIFYMVSIYLIFILDSNNSLTQNFKQSRFSFFTN